MRKPLGGLQLERGLVHEVQLMMMHSNAIACWPNLRQAYRDGQRIRTRSCAGVAGSNTSGADRHSGACVCQVIPGKLIVLCLLIDLSILPPNRRLLRNAHRSPTMMGVPAVLTCALAHGRLQRTALGAREIGAFLKRGFGSTAI